MLDKFSIFAKMKIMRINYVFFLIVVLFCYKTNAQSINIVGSNSIMYNSTSSIGNDTLDPCLQTNSYLTIKNISNKEHNILCRKRIISETTGADNYFCWGGNCYGVGTTLSTEFLTLASNQSDDVSFGGYFDAYCDDQAQAIVEYCFFPNSDTLDRSCIFITYHGPATSVSDLSPVIMSDFYPNPTSQIIRFDYYYNKPSNLIIVDVLGNQVKLYNIETSSQNKIDMSDLPNGIYFGNLIIDNEIVKMNKIVKK